MNGNGSSNAYDVVILGGGLAGLTLAIQLKRKRPETSVAIAEKRAGPAPLAAFKVGESTADPGAFYYREVVGMFDHLDNEHIRKYGLRFFFPAEGNRDLARRAELGTPSRLDLASFQIDRGLYENALADRCRELGVEILSGAFVDAIEIAKPRHKVTVVRGGPGGERSVLEGRWLVDASGRGRLLVRKLGLAKDTTHTINAAWIRLDGGLDIEDLSNAPEWHARMHERGARRRSTSHLMGKGYWVWLIQLATGPISIGVCADPRFHPFSEIDSLDGFIDWLHEHEPQFGEIIDKRRDQVMDFLTVKDFSHSTKRVYSSDRWCLTGEAGAFLDPLYSPGSDYIGYANTFITDLVTRDLAGEEVTPSSPLRRLRTKIFFGIAAKSAKADKPSKPPFDVVKATKRVARDSRLEFFDFLFFQIFQGNLHTYDGQYALYGNAQVMVAKILFGLDAYWGTLGMIFFNHKLTDPDFLAELLDPIDRYGRITKRMEMFFREWDALETREWKDTYIDTSRLTHLLARQEDLVAPFPGTDEELQARIKQNVEEIAAMAVILFHKGAELLPEKPGDDVPINALAVSLQPERWEKDGLFSAPGISLTEARKMAPGTEEMLFSEQRAGVASATPA